MKQAQRNPAKDMVVLHIPLSALHCLSEQPKAEKLLCEIDVEELQECNEGKTLDEVINQGRLDYALGKYQTCETPEEVLQVLHA